MRDKGLRLEWVDPFPHQVMCERTSSQRIVLPGVKRAGYAARAPFGTRSFLIEFA